MELFKCYVIYLYKSYNFNTKLYNSPQICNH